MSWPPRLDEVVERHVGGRPVVVEATRAEGAARVFDVRGGSARVWLKLHRQVRTADQEATALAVAQRAGLAAPRVLERTDRALVLSHVHGRQPRDPAAWARAGRWLAEWHAVPCACDDPLPVVDAIQRRVEAWATRARRLGLSELVEVLRLTPEERLAFTDAPRVWCHRDYHPRNWLDDGLVCAVIDFEHARPDVAELDLAKVRASGAGDERIRAFESGYGQASDPRRLAWGDRFHAVVTLLWGLQRGHQPVVDEGLRAVVALGIVSDQWRPARA